ncbi:MAG TPA: hypothetical protein VN605_02355, partial [Thermoanaerobaculia bacterium]|nr:hypothetical protein [Thermoanaerobaculia bacterium]
GHIYRESDYGALECLLGMVLYFSWDASIFCGDATWLRISHDEFFSVNAISDSELRRWQEMLAEFELEELTGTVDNRR